MLPAAIPLQSFQNFRAFIGLMQEANGGVASRDAETQTDQQIDTLPAQQLPPEVWRHIFRYLSVVQLKKVRRVCRGWKQAVDGSAPLLGRMVLKFPTGKTMDENFRLECNMKIPSVVIQQARIISYVGDKQWWTTLAKRLTCLSLDDTRICVFELFRMLHKTPQLQELSLDNIYFPSYDLTRVVKCSVLKRMRKFSVFSQQYEVLFHFFGKAFPRLKWFECVDPLEDEDDDEELVRYLKTAQSPLESIKITGTDAILDTLNTLKQLKLKQVFLLSVASPLKVLQLVRMHSTITVLILELCTLSNANIAEIGKALPQLHSFESFVVADPNTWWKPTFMHDMQRLKRLSIGHTFGKYLTARFDDIDHMALRALHLSNLEIRCPGHLLRLAYRIYEIALVDCTFASWSDMFDSIPYDLVWSLKLASIKVSSHMENLVCRFRYLRCLELINLSMDQSLLQTMFELMSSLEAVRLECLEHANDAVVNVMLANNKETLNKISLRNIHITDIAVDHIIGECRKLELLDIRSCEKISSAAMKRLETCGRFELRSSFKVTKEKSWV